MPDSWKENLRFYVRETEKDEQRFKEGTKKAEEVARLFTVKVIDTTFQAIEHEWNLQGARYTAESFVATSPPFVSSLLLYVDDQLVFQFNLKMLITSTGPKVTSTVGDPNGVTESSVSGLPSGNAKVLTQDDLIQVILPSIRKALQSRFRENTIL